MVSGSDFPKKTNPLIVHIFVGTANPCNEPRGFFLVGSSSRQRGGTLRKPWTKRHRPSQWRGGDDYFRGVMWGDLT